MLRILFVILAATLFSHAADSAASVEPNPWRSLFDGTTLTGWSVKSGNATYRVEDGAIIGTYANNSTTTFLCPDETFTDFELTFEVRLDNAELNTGVQIRSVLAGDKLGGSLTGPQIEIADGGATGFIFGQGLKGWMQDPKSGTNPPVAPLVIGEWTSFRALAVGPHIQTWIRDKPVADLILNAEQQAAYGSGRIGLQVHGVKPKQGLGPHQVRFRNIQIRVISDKAPSKP